MSLAHFPVHWRFDGTTQGTVTIDRSAGTFTIRPYRRKKSYTLPLAFVAQVVVERCIKADVFRARMERAKVRRGR